MHLVRAETPLGEIILGASDDGLKGAWFTKQKHFPRWLDTPIDKLPIASRSSHGKNAVPPVLQLAVEELDVYFAGKLRTFTVPMKPEGTTFQESIWKALQTIPYGETVTYATVAERAGHGGSFRAAGAATGRNPLSIFIPCHRVISTAGKLTGYAGGIDRKVFLLKLENPNTQCRE